jgi:hypothetical protein
LRQLAFLIGCAALQHSYLHERHRDFSVLK